MDGTWESALLERVREGDPEQRARALEQVLEHLGPGLERLCVRMCGNEVDAQDALQETFVSIHLGLSGFRGEAKLSTWAYRIGVRTCLAQRAKWRRNAAEPLVAEPGVGPDDATSVSELAQALDRAVAELRPAYRAVFSLCCIEELERAQVADILGIPEGTVWTRLHRARKELATKLGPFL